MIEVRQISKTEWKELSKSAHELVFGEKWDPSHERIDYALLTVDSQGTLVQYATIRELDTDTAYIHYGGSFPDYRGSITSYESFVRVTKWLFERYKNVSFLTENTNLAMLKFAIKQEFIIIGVRNWAGHIMLEHLKRRRD